MLKKLRRWWFWNVRVRRWTIYESTQSKIIRKLVMLGKHVPD